MRVVAIIPCRGGSKGVYRKNIADLAGKPLMAYTIEQAQASKLVDQIIVSTEDIEIQDVALHYGAGVIPRPGHLAYDDVMVWEAVRHAAESYQSSHSLPDYFVELHTTYPFRTPDLIDETLECMSDAVNFDGCLVASHVFDRIWRKLDKKGAGYLRAFPEREIQMRQHQKPLFIDHYGLVNVYKPNLALLGNPYRGNLNLNIYGGKIESFDIDDNEDMMIAKRLIKQNLKAPHEARVKLFPPTVV